MSAKHTQGRLVEDTRGPRADIRSESGRIVAVTYGLGLPKTEEGLKKRTQEDRANRRRLVACWNACDGLTTEALESLGTLDRASVQRDVHRIAQLEAEWAELRELQRQCREAIAKATGRPA